METLLVGYCCAHDLCMYVPLHVQQGGVAHVSITDIRLGGHSSCFTDRRLGLIDAVRSARSRPPLVTAAVCACTAETRPWKPPQPPPCWCLGVLVWSVCLTDRAGNTM